MEFGGSMEYNVRNIFLKISYSKYRGETSSRPKKSKLIISLYPQFEILYSLLLFYFHFEDYDNVLKLRYFPLAFTSYKAFL